MGGHSTKSHELVGALYGDNNHMAVLETAPRCGAGKLQYKVKCSVCALDPELHGDATYTVSRASILNYNRPCGCARRPLWTEEQSLTRVRREGVKRGFEVLGWAAPRKGSMCRQQITLKCSKDGHVWDAILNNFFSGAGCPACKVLHKAHLDTKSDEAVLADIDSTGKFAEGSIFCRLPKIIGDASTEHRWQYKCSKCSKDEHVQRGDCSGVFESTQTRLSMGFMACHCPTHGYKKGLEGHVYVLIASDGISRFTGYGITNHIDNRRKTHDKNLSKDNFIIEEWQVYNVTGYRAASIEQAIIQNFERVPQKTIGFKKEATHGYNYEEVLDFVESLIEQGENSWIALKL